MIKCARRKGPVKRNSISANSKTRPRWRNPLKIEPHSMTNAQPMRVSERTICRKKDSWRKWKSMPKAKRSAAKPIAVLGWRSLRKKRSALRLSNTNQRYVSAGAMGEARVDEWISGLRDYWSIGVVQCSGAWMDDTVDY